MKKKEKENVKEKNASYDNDLKKERNIKRKITRANKQEKEIYLHEAIF